MQFVLLAEETELIVPLGRWVLEEVCRQIRACIDDFGTGYSSLSYLQSLPVDTLKIDRAFVSDIERSRKNFDIVKTILTLARSLGLETVAEGIETPQELDILRDLGCEYGQGFYFSRPLDREACEAWAMAGRLELLHLVQ